MKCPKCNSPMAQVTNEAGTVDQCQACAGLWFDRFEAPRQAEFAARIDTGDAARGERYNEVDRISCPKCANTPLTRMVDKDQPHIWFEQCPSCGGRFFDAGEFRDLADSSVSDFLKRFTGRGRAA